MGIRCPVYQDPKFLSSKSGLKFFSWDGIFQQSATSAYNHIPERHKFEKLNVVIFLNFCYLFSRRPGICLINKKSSDKFNLFETCSKSLCVFCSALSWVGEANLSLPIMKIISNIPEKTRQ